MKSRHEYRFWFISLAVHLCLAIVFSFITINRTNSRDVNALYVSILKVKPAPPVEKLPRVKTPTVTPIIPPPDFQIKPQLASAKTRALTTQPVKSTSEFATKAVAVDTLVSQPRPHSARTDISAQGIFRSSHVNHRPAQPLATAVNLPTQSYVPLTTGPSGGGSLSDGEGSGSSVGRGAFNSGNDVDGTWEGDHVGLSSVVDAEGAANIDDALSDVIEKVVLGGGVPELPHGTPGAIVVGRGRDIKGRLNLARFEDPLHPSADI